MSEENQAKDVLLEQAMDWHLRLHNAPHDFRLAQGLRDWLSQSPDHFRAWSRAVDLWTALGDLTPRAVGAVSQGRPPASKFTRYRWGKRLRGGTAAVVVACAACAALLWLPSLSLYWQAWQWNATALTSTGEVQQLELPDGSMAYLAPHSAVRQDYSLGERRLVLFAGEAYFEVKPDPARPFVVQAGEVQAIALGTAYTVHLGESTVQVAVARGRVAVERLAAEDAAADQGASLQRSGDIVEPGQMLTLSRQGYGTTQTTLIPEDVGAWRQGDLFVADQSVANVVERINAFHRGWIVITDPHLGAKRVNGLYDLKDPLKALQAVVSPFGGVVREMTPFFYVISKS